MVNFVFKNVKLITRFMTMPVKCKEQNYRYRIF